MRDVLRSRADCRDDAFYRGIDGSGDQMDFSQRANLAELMDEPCSFAEFQACLRDLEKVNRLTGSYRPTLGWLHQLIAARPKHAEPLHVVDVGCGHGDMLRQIAAWARKRAVAVELTGVDLNPHAARAAREVQSSADITWITGDAFSVALPRQADVVISSLFTHHLPEAEIVRFLAWMEASARVGWLVNDLHRSRSAYHLFRGLATVMQWHRFVQHDGPVSIRRAFSASDWQRMCTAAGLGRDEVRIVPRFPSRLCVERLK